MSSCYPPNPPNLLPELAPSKKVPLWQNHVRNADSFHQSEISVGKKSIAKIMSMYSRLVQQFLHSPTQQVWLGASFPQKDSKPGESTKKISPNQKNILWFESQKKKNFQLRDGFQSWIQGPDAIKTLYRIHLACWTSVFFHDDLLKLWWSEDSWFNWEKMGKKNAHKQLRSQYNSWIRHP